MVLYFTSGWIFLIPSAPTSACYTIILFASTSGTHLDGNECCSLIGLAGFLLQCTCCCHGFGWGCAAVFFFFPSSICLGCQLGGKCCDFTHFLTGGGGGGGIRRAATPLPSHWHTPTQRPAHSPTVRKTPARGWTCFVHRLNTVGGAEQITAA